MLTSLISPAEEGTETEAEEVQAMMISSKPAADLPTIL